MRKHILPILFVLLMILLAGCSKSSEQPQNTEINSSSVGEITELKQDETETDEPSISTTESTALSNKTQVVTEPTESQEKEVKEPASSSESKPTEETKPTTETNPVETKPAETKPTEATQPPTEPTEESQETETESEPEPVYQVPDRSEVEALVAAYINSYRTSNATVLSGLTEVARYRSRELITNFAHTDGISACNALQYGEFVDMTLYGMSENDSYYQGYNREAIAKGNWGGTADEIAQRIANGFKNSSSHWKYLGSSEYSYMAVGCTYDEASSMWYCCICVSSKNYGG